MKTRRRITLRCEAFMRNLSTTLFWMRNGHRPLQAWEKAKVTLP